MSIKIFISWAGPRSRVLASCIQEWLPNVLPNVELFHSDDIQKGDRWYEALTKALSGCDVGIFCVTPESLRSQWMLFEAGALSQVSEKPRLFAYLYGISNIGGPLGQFQTTKFDQDDSWKLVSSLASIRDTKDMELIRKSFDNNWEIFEAKVIRLIAIPIENVLPDFLNLFNNKKTFYESFSECSNRQWEDRIERIARIRERLSTPEFYDVMSSDPYMSGAYNTLISLLDKYDMHISSHLIQRLDFDSLTKKKQDQLEGVRRQIIDVVRGLQQYYDPPVFRESFGFESDSSTSSRKMIIQKMKMKLKEKRINPKKIVRAARSINWGLDRIVFYLAIGSGEVTDTPLDDLLDLVRIEEEQARTRELISGLQPLYYVLECLDERITIAKETSTEPIDTTTTKPVDAKNIKRMIVLLGDIQRFVNAKTGRDTGDHIKRRLNSLRRKLENTTVMG